RRLLEDEKDGTMFGKLEKAKGVLKREVPLSARKYTRVLGNRKANPPRGYRIATLTFSACSVEVKAPPHLSNIALRLLSLTSCMFKKSILQKGRNQLIGKLPQAKALRR